MNTALYLIYRSGSGFAYSVQQISVLPEYVCFSSIKKIIVISSLSDLLAWLFVSCFVSDFFVVVGFCCLFILMCLVLLVLFVVFSYPVRWPFPCLTLDFLRFFCMFRSTVSLSRNQHLFRIRNQDEHGSKESAG